MPHRKNGLNPRYRPTLPEVVCKMYVFAYYPWKNIIQLESLPRGNYYHMTVADRMEQNNCIINNLDFLVLVNTFPLPSGVVLRLTPLEIKRKMSQTWGNSLKAIKIMNKNTMSCVVLLDYYKLTSIKLHCIWLEFVVCTHCAQVF